MLPGTLVNLLQADHSIKIESVVPVSGGCINNAVCISSDQGKFCLKWNSRTSPGMFSCEAQGLELIAAAQIIRVPHVYAYGDSSPDGLPGYILMEWIEPPTTRLNNMALLGEQLAQFHLNSANTIQGFGLDHNNFIGSSRQINTWSDNWCFFFYDRRLGYQKDLAIQNGLLPIPRRNRLETLLNRLERYLSDRIDLHPSLLHGDLWAGNIISDGAGRPVLIDPAVYYGDREAEIAFTELFGGFTPAFYQAYHAAFPLEPGYRERRDLYNLYHLLNHLNLFGEIYGQEVDGILKHYVP